MNLTSCNGCGAVFDARKLQFPTEIYLRDGSINVNVAVWVEDESGYFPMVPCPVCSHPIVQED